MEGFTPVNAAGTSALVPRRSHSTRGEKPDALVVGRTRNFLCVLPQIGCERVRPAPMGGTGKSAKRPAKVRELLRPYERRRAELDSSANPGIAEVSPYGSSSSSS